MKIVIRVDDGGNEDIVARRIVEDLGFSEDLGFVELMRRPAEPGQKGIIEEVGSVVVTLLNAGGAQYIFNVLRPLLSVGREQVSDERTAILELPNGARLELRGGMSDADFLTMQDRLISIVDRDTKGEAT